MSEQMTIEEVQGLELEMLDYLNDVCRVNAIEYSLAYGTALGACRDNGFIPWDDDVDVYVPRSEMNRLIAAVNDEGGLYRVFVPNETPGYRHPYPKLVRTDTKLVEPKNKPVPDLGVFIDLFPCDFVSSESLMQKARQRVVNLLNKVYCQIYVRNHSGDGFLLSLLRLLSLVASAVPPQFFHRINETIATAFTETDAQPGDWLASPYDECRLLPVDFVFPSTRHVFSNRTYLAPAKLNEYCRIIYGDEYMRPIRTDNAFHGVVTRRDAS